METNGDGVPRSLAPIPRALGGLIEPLYRAVISHRNRGFDTGRGVVDVGVPVLSVGNISVGGVGKTPMVMRLVGWLREAGHRPAVAMRGYRARRGRPSDEQAQYLEQCPDLPVVARPDRAAGIIPLVRSGVIDCVVLDDGFQHRRIARALDIVLIDATRDPFTDRCLPAGWLREPVESLRRGGGHAIVLTHTESVDASRLDALRGRIEGITGHAPIAESRHVWAGLLGSEGAGPVEGLRGASVIVACAIGNPGAFARAAAEAGTRIHAIVARRDHHEWTGRDARLLAGLAERHSAQGTPALVLTTEKDWMKLRRIPPADLPDRIARPVLEIEFTRGEEALRGVALRSVPGLAAG